MNKIHSNFKQVLWFIGCKFLPRKDLGNKGKNRILKIDQTRLTDANFQFKNVLSNEQFEKQEVTKVNH